LLVVVAIVGVLSTLAITQVLRARMASNAAAALGSLRAINTAEQGYAHQCQGFAVSLTELRLAGNFLSPDLSATDTVTKSGYQFDMVAGQGNTALAVPIPLQDSEVTLTSLQLIGPRLSEAQLLNAGRLVEAAVKNEVENAAAQPNPNLR